MTPSETSIAEGLSEAQPASWAIERARAMYLAWTPVASHSFNNCLLAFAAYVQQHEEPPPSVDNDVLAVRAILHAHQRAMTPPDSGWGNMSYLKGSYDHLPIFIAALVAYRSAKVPS